MAFPPDSIAADKTGSGDLEHPNHHNALANAVNDITTYVSGFSGGYLVAPSGGDDTNTIQESLNTNVRTTLGPGTWRADGLVIPSGHTLTGTGGPGAAFDTSALTIIKANDGATSDWVVEFSGTALSGAAGAAGAVLERLAIVGNDLCGGVKVVGSGQRVSNVNIHGTSVEGLYANTGASFFENIVVTDAHNDGYPVAATGAAYLAGADNFYTNCEFSGLPGFAGGEFFGGNFAACYVATANSVFNGVIGEFGDYGFHVATSAYFNKWTNCRADNNWGHGFFLNATAWQMFSSCTAHDNSKEAANTYDQWHLLNSGVCALVSCNAFASDAVDARYGFFDNTPAGIEQNKYAAVAARNGWDTAEFGGGATFTTGVVSSVADDTSPQLGGTLDTNGYEIVFPASMGVGDKITLFDGGEFTDYKIGIAASKVYYNTGVTGSHEFRDDGTPIAEIKAAGITVIAEPTLDAHLATKLYVDSRTVLHDVVITVPSTVTQSDALSPWRAPRAGTLVEVECWCDTAPVTASWITDVHKNGTTVFTTQSNRPTVATSSTSDKSGAPEVTAFTAGDLFQPQIDQLNAADEGNLGAMYVRITWSEAVS